MVINYDKLAEELGLTELQKRFAEFYVYVTGLDGPAAVELSGYKIDKSEYANYDENLQNVYKHRAISYKLRELLNNNEVVRYIDALRKNLENNLIIDKLWVIKNLKDLAVNGSETNRIRALELLGKHLEMFTDKQKIERGEDPAELAKNAFDNRKKIIAMNKKQENE